MNRILLIVMIVFLPSSSMPSYDALITLANTFTENEFHIDQWQVVMREKISRARAISYLNQLQDTNDIHVRKDENMTKYVSMYTQNHEVLTVSYNIIVPHQQNIAEIIVIIEGEHWDDMTMEKYRHTFVDIYRHYFTADIMIYACISSTLDAIMESVYIFDEFTYKLDLKQVEIQSDSTLSSLHNHMMYGYTSLLDTSKLIILDQPVNVQIVVQHTEIIELKHTKVTVGTPILINEY